MRLVYIIAWHWVEFINNFQFIVPNVFMIWNLAIQCHALDLHGGSICCWVNSVVKVELFPGSRGTQLYWLSKSKVKAKKGGRGDGRRILDCFTETHYKQMDSDKRWKGNCCHPKCHSYLEFLPEQSKLASKLAVAQEGKGT